jgi:hypothetical protein
MQKNYKNKELKADNEKVKDKQNFFFPKANPPITIEAETIEEAQEKLQVIQNKKHE